MDGQTDKQTDGHTDGKTDGQTDGHLSMPEIEIFRPEIVRRQEVEDDVLDLVVVLLVQKLKPKIHLLSLPLTLSQSKLACLSLNLSEVIFDR
jgi:hypothetical protein